ncbi:2-amino-thiazoline-4-carboxylic acid hydrolase [Pleomorphomonas diazotrophica]|uniref:2-amino-thiazoline-4-carboxylic acid hydrolase n=1 Tax=Pleomorphomonas diazotrophica TaxID=1166257 RepID=A0A1I4SSR9_9HYPH|nr:L-2-amino-thiazoline-4-carboxylic acid hydrolase [Pleomorphomonas diazotrophica]PKR88512.1 2-amino-thiazoline-4-carboxylic acid hydrolase [Pleomorphomonas diazotrophica]SFM67536.1 L-2-amino-thiazoline-4-carboxylic acid hydrolase [Pleomorphomonas diazotrophica]
MPMPIIERRRIEAEIVGHLYRELVTRFGEGPARQAIDAAIRKAAVAHGEKCRVDLGHTPDFADFEAILPAWTAEDALTIEVKESTADRFSYDVTRCRYAETYREMGLADIGALLSCNRDAAFCEGYNPAMRLERTETIMEGGRRCDFRYRLDKTGD